MVNRTVQKLGRTGQRALEILFEPAETPLTKWIGSLFLVVLFAVGILHWGYFLNWFKNSFDIGDWHNIVDPMLVFLTNAFRSGQLPMHGNSPLFVPDRYLGRPDRPLSPQLLLLYFVDPAKYVVINVWIFFTIGFISLLVIRRRYHLSLASFTALFMLFNFNGHITDHYVVGHMEWVGYFLLPLFVLLVLKMLEGEKTGWGWVFGVALTMLAINLQGAVHFFIYCMVFLSLIALFQPRFWMPAIKAVIASVLLSMLRLLPLAIQYYNGGGVQFIFGFLSVSHMLDSFIVLHPPYILDTPSGQIGGWEVDYYLGLIGFLFMIYFGVFRNWVNQKSYRLLYFPMLVMAFFSMGDVYRPIFNSHIPFMDSQRAPTRFIIIPVVFLIILACIQFQNWINERNANGWMERVAVLFGLAFTGYDLFGHSRAWRLATMSSKVLQKFTDVVAVPLVNRPDPPYVISIIIGLVLTVGAAVGLSILFFRERKQAGSKA
ncbi:MAG: hypothetical protein ABSA01_01795 [Anaerolineales bacterium]|jgi:hypothetical protein